MRHIDNFEADRASHAFALHGFNPMHAEGDDAILVGLPTQTEHSFVHGTLITTAGGALPIDDLREGELVITACGAKLPIRAIEHTRFGGDFIDGETDLLPVCLKAGALAEGMPLRDLWMSPWNALYIENVLIPAGQLVNGTSIVQPDYIESVDYYRLRLDTHAIIQAEGAPAESWPAPDRIAEHARVSGHDRGPFLAGILKNLDRRAKRFDAPSRPGRLHGFVDEISPDRVAGWAQDLADPESPVPIILSAGGLVIAHLLANKFRPDLAEIGIGSGRHSFEFRPAAPFDTHSLGALRLRRSSDGALIPGKMLTRAA